MISFARSGTTGLCRCTFKYPAKVQNSDDFFILYRADIDPNPVDVATFEEIFEARGAKRCWNPGRLTSPLALHYAFPANYERFCSSKTKVDKNLLLSSGYLQGTILSTAAKHR